MLLEVMNQRSSVLIKCSGALLRVLGRVITVVLPQIGVIYMLCSRVTRSYFGFSDPRFLMNIRSCKTALFVLHPEFYGDSNNIIATPAKQHPEVPAKEESVPLRD